MLAQQRQALILEEISRLGAVRVTDIAQSMHVSDMTVRRDLDALAEAGLVVKVHGGATKAGSSSVTEPAFSAKLTRERAAKAAIAAEASRLVQPGSAIAVSGGTTTHAFARTIVGIPGLTVVTNSLPLAEVFHVDGADDQTIILTGGSRTPSDALVGPVAVDALARLHVDQVFMGTHGMEFPPGFTSPNLLEADTNRALVAAGQRLIVLADHTKWGVVGLSAFAKLDDADLLITDERIPEEALATLRTHVEEVAIARSQLNEERSA